MERSSGVSPDDCGTPGRVGRRQIILIEKMPRCRSAELRGHVPAVALRLATPPAIAAIKMVTISANLAIASSCVG
jgi:hypothetical protein